MLLFKIWPVSIGISLSFRYKFPCSLTNCNEIHLRGAVAVCGSPNYSQYISFVTSPTLTKCIPLLPHYKLVAHPIVLINVDTWAITAHIDVNPFGIGIEGLCVHQDASGVIDVHFRRLSIKGIRDGNHCAGRIGIRALRADHHLIG